MLLAFGKRVHQIRIKKKLSQRQVAYMADIEVSQVSRIERGMTNPTLSTIVAISEALKIPLTKLMDIDSQPHNKP